MSIAFIIYSAIGLWVLIVLTNGSLRVFHDLVMEKCAVTEIVRIENMRPTALVADGSFSVQDILSAHGGTESIRSYAMHTLAQKILAEAKRFIIFRESKRDADQIITIYAKLFVAMPE